MQRISEHNDLPKMEIVACVLQWGHKWVHKIVLSWCLLNTWLQKLTSDPAQKMQENRGGQKEGKKEAILCKKITCCLLNLLWGGEQECQELT